MRSPAKSVLCFLVLCLISARVASAQERASSKGAHPVTREASDRPQKAIQPRPLTLGEGLAILSAALDSRHYADSASDCSHFVHELYERAGFPYEYASSSDLYAGAEEFRRVANPQPGDLAVWRGHAGIVINPVQHSFFSVLHSGPGVDSYDSSYWKQRGRPRFFRYVKAAPSGVSSPLQTASLKPAVLGRSDSREPVTDNPVLDASDESSSETVPSAKFAEKQPAKTTDRPAALVNSVRPKPDQVEAAFLQACTDSDESLRGRDLSKPYQSLVVFDHFEVKKVHLAGNQDWVDVQIDELVSLTGSKAEVHRRSERQRWPLTRRDNKSWELTPSRGTIYLPQPMAVRVLARELAQLTEDTPDTTGRTRQAQLARLLDVLLGE
jgi:NlpC/P60 family